MDAISAFADDALDFGKPALKGIVCFQSTTRPKSRPDNGKYDAVEKRLELCIEGTIYEDITG